jgi:hypothetical protein
VSWHLAALIALTPATGVPVALPPPTEPAPTNVTLAWTSDAHTSAMIRWDETGDVRDQIDIVRADGSATFIASQFAEAGQPNEVPLFGGLYDTDFRILVRVVDADGTALSDPASSPEFDTDRVPAAVIKSVVPREDGSILMTWAQGTYTDPNPGDPLDIPPVTPYRYTPVASVIDFNDWDDVGKPTTATSFVVPARESPVKVGLRSPTNEWYGWTGTDAQVEGNRLTTRIPSSATIGGKLTVTGKSVRLTRICDPGPCWFGEWDDQGREVRLQTRTARGAPWRTVATAKARKGGAYTLKAGFAGTGDYRVVEPAINFTPPDGDARAFAATAVTTVRGVTGPVDDNDTGGQGGGLPITGAPVAWIAVAGGLLVALGMALAAAGRIRRRGGDTP